MMDVCRYLMDNPLPQRFIRELDIPGVYSKFIEQNKMVLRELLDSVLPASAIRGEITSIAGHGFGRRFGFRFDEPLICFRLLDASLAAQWGISDISVLLVQLHTFFPRCGTIIVTGLSFPPLQGAMVIFGLGYGISSLQDVEWL